MNKSPIFLLKDVTYRIGDTSILDSISGQFYPNEITCITGPSGAGKTTLLRLLNGLQSPTSGTLLFLNQSIDKIDFRHLRKKVGLVFQSPVIIDGTIKDNLSVAKEWATNTNGFDDKNLTQSLQSVGLQGISLSQNAHDLSGGEKQRIQLARVLLNRPSVLLLDEPTANLDSDSATTILQLIQSLTNEYQLTTIMVSHDKSHVRQYGNRIFSIQNHTLTEL